MELVTETAKSVRGHIDKTINYKNLIPGASEGWVIHLTREDDYLQHPLWPTNSDLDAGISMIHIWRNKDFTDVRLSAKWKDPDGQTMTVENQ
ncbi:hypothetical protein BGZ98_000321, partial [Dissophora globulifera]